MDLYETSPSYSFPYRQFPGFAIPVFLGGPECTKSFFLKSVSWAWDLDLCSSALEKVWHNFPLLGAFVFFSSAALVGVFLPFIATVLVTWYYLLELGRSRTVRALCPQETRLYDGLGCRIFCFRLCRSTLPFFFAFERAIELLFTAASFHPHWPVLFLFTSILTFCFPIRGIPAP